MDSERQELNDLVKLIGLLSSEYLRIKQVKEGLNLSREVVNYIENAFKTGHLNSVKISLASTNQNQKIMFEKFLEGDDNPFSYRSNYINPDLSRIDYARRIVLWALDEFDYYSFMDDVEITRFNNILNWEETTPNIN